MAFTPKLVLCGPVVAPLDVGLLVLPVPRPIVTLKLSRRRRIPTSIGTKSLTITEEAYDRLKEYKRDDESFTDTILRLTGDDRDVMKGFGMMSDVEGFRETVEQTREDLDTDFRERNAR